MPTIYADLTDAGIEISTTSPETGAHDFVVTGVDGGHSFILVKTDDTAADVIAAESGGAFDSSDYTADIVFDTNAINEGDSVTVEGVNLEEGHYIYACDAAGDGAEVYDLTVVARSVLLTPSLFWDFHELSPSMAFRLGVIDGQHNYEDQTLVSGLQDDYDEGKAFGEYMHPHLNPTYNG